MILDAGKKLIIHEPFFRLKNFKIRLGEFWNILTVTEIDAIYIYISSLDNIEVLLQFAKGCTTIDYNEKKQKSNLWIKAGAIRTLIQNFIYYEANG